MKIPLKSLERRLFAKGYRYVIGVDEVGMGCLAGPVGVCAAVFTAGFYAKRHKKLQWLRDSKMLQEHQREKYASALMTELLKDSTFRCQVALAPVQTIDEINVYQAARQAMKQAISKLNVPPEQAIVLVDGRGKIPGLAMEQVPVVKGDRKVFAIACASVIAKVHRDKLMTRLAKKYPGYGLEKHKGYATREHRAAIHQNGPTPLHRRSFNVK